MKFCYITACVFLILSCHSGEHEGIARPIDILRFNNSKINDPLINPFQILVEERINLLVMEGSKIVVYQEDGPCDTIDIPQIRDVSYFFAINKDSILLFSKNDRCIYLYDVVRMKIFSVFELPVDTLPGGSVVEYRPRNAVPSRPYNIYYELISVPLSFYSKSWQVEDYVDYLSKSPTHLMLNLKDINQSFFLGFIPRWCTTVNQLIKNRAWNGLEYSTVISPIDKNRFLLSHVFSDTVYVIDSKSKIIDNYIMRSRYVKMPPITFSESNLDYREYATITPQYIRIIFDKKKNVVYRICEHATFSNGDFKVQGDGNWSIIKYDISRRSIKEYYFPGGHYYCSDVHLYQDGLLISNKGYKNAHYDKKGHSYTYFEFD